MMKKKKKENSLRWLFYFLDNKINFFLCGKNEQIEMLDLSFSISLSLSLFLFLFLFPLLSLWLTPCLSLSCSQL